MNRGVRRIWNRLLGSLWGRRRESDLAEELDSHIQLLADENIRRGFPPEVARRLARLQFGSVESAKESYRDQRGLPAVDILVHDLRYAFRGIGKNPGFAAVAILSLAIGIGANTAIFSLVNGVLLQPLAFKDPQRLFAVREVSPQLNNGRVMPVNPLHTLEWGAQCPSIEQAALMNSNQFDLASGGDPVSIPGADVSAHLFPMFGVEPILGRTFLPEEEREGRQSVVMLSESLWRSRFHADPAILGQPIVIDRQNHRVVGIMPASFRLPFAGASNVAEIFRPLVLTPQELSRVMGNFNYAAVVRVRPGRSEQQALSEINVVQARFPALAGRKVDLRAVLIPVHEAVTGHAQLSLWMLAAAVGARC